MTPLESEYRQVADQLAETQSKLGALPKPDPGRDDLKRDLGRLLARMGKLKEEIKTENTRKNFAGLGNSPLYLACSERLPPPELSELERRALEIQVERERVAAERKAAKTVVPEPVDKPRGGVEVAVLRPNRSGA